MRAAKFFCFFLLIALSAAKAQSSAPIIVQAASPTTATTTTSAAPGASSIPEAIQLLEKIKAANNEVLAKQKAALERLDELQQAADELRIFSKRG